MESSLIATLAAGFTMAWFLGIVTQKLRLSPIVGYLIAGVLIGPHTPGFVGDVHLAEQLAEVGVILLMFGVGLHFHWKSLAAVRNIAIPGALGQSVAATLLAMGMFALFGMSLATGAVIGIAISVASTVVLMRVLQDANQLDTPRGHIAVGWLLVEDVLTVIVLVMLPVMAGDSASGPIDSPWLALGVALLKLAALVVVMILLGLRAIPWVLVQVARLRSRELFTLTVLVFSVAIAAASHYVFGASMALGAFLAGMVVAQSPVSHQAAADALPMRDAFAVLFFVSVGMMFDPAFLIEQPWMVLAGLSIVLIGKPLVALLIILALGHSTRTALTVAIGLAQIGEFSFILSDVARSHGLMGMDGHNVLVASAILSITINPILFRSLPAIERVLRARSKTIERLERKVARLHAELGRTSDSAGETVRRAIIVGYGPVGRSVDSQLQNVGIDATVLDLNMDTIAALRAEGRLAIFGDATRQTVLESAGLENAICLVVTLPIAADRAAVVAEARELSPALPILVRAHYLREAEELRGAGVTAVAEETEVATELARLVVSHVGVQATANSEAEVRDPNLRLKEAPTP